MSERDHIRDLIHKYGYSIIIEDTVDRRLPINTNIESMYRSMDMIVSVLTDDMAICIHSLAVQLNMRKSDHTKAECDLMEEIVLSTRMIQSIVDSGINNTDDQDERIRRLSAALDLTHIISDIMHRAHNIELYGNGEEFINDGIDVLDSASMYQSELLTEKVRKERK